MMMEVALTHQETRLTSNRREEGKNGLSTLHEFAQFCIKVQVKCAMHLHALY